MKQTPKAKGFQALFDRLTKGMGEYQKKLLVERLLTTLETLHPKHN